MRKEHIRDYIIEAHMPEFFLDGHGIWRPPIIYCLLSDSCSGLFSHWMAS